MATSQKSRQVAPRRSQETRAAAPAVASKRLVDAAISSGKSAALASLTAKRPYLKFAFANPYNLSLFLGLLAAAGLTLNPFLALAAIGLEAIWLLHAPDSKRLRHILWDPRFEQVREALEAQERAERLAGVGDEERARVEDLVAHRAQIRRLAEQNPMFTAGLVEQQMAQTDRLVASFVELTINCWRYEQYLGTVDDDQLERERDRWEDELKRCPPGDPQSELARRNLGVILMRKEKMKEIRRYLGLARGQLDLIENTFQLLADQIVTMQSPQELSGQLDSLIDGVEAIRESAVATADLLESLGLGANT